MGQCYITRRGIKTGTAKQLGIYPTGDDGRPAGDVTVLDNVVDLSHYVFQSNRNVTSIAFPDSLKTISDNACRDCSSLASVNLPESLTKIGSTAFMGCSSLKDVTASDNASYILLGNTFRSCSVLTNESFNNIMKHCSSVNGSYDFSQCQGLTDIETPVLGNYMLFGCSKLIRVRSLGGSDTKDNTFANCTALEEAYIADGTTIIGARIFGECKSLKTVFLPSSITAARDSSLTTSTTAKYAFQNCTALEDVQLGQDWNMDLRLDVSEKITHDSMSAMFNSLKDLTGETAKTLTLGSVNLAKLTDAEKAVATNKNWILA